MGSFLQDDHLLGYTNNDEIVYTALLLDSFLTSWDYSFYSSPNWTRHSTFVHFITNVTCVINDLNNLRY